jgi:TRAP-type C4-dicarboxylate transport system permease large subunit
MPQSAVSSIGKLFFSGIKPSVNLCVIFWLATPLFNGSKGVMVWVHDYSSLSENE